MLADLVEELRALGYPGQKLEVTQKWMRLSIPERVFLESGDNVSEKLFAIFRPYWSDLVDVVSMIDHEKDVVTLTVRIAPHAYLKSVQEVLW